MYASTIEFNIVTLGLFVGLFIACVKGYLVAANFMHLNNEKSFIYGTLFLAVVFFIVLMSIPLSWDMNGFDVKTNRNNAFDEYKIVKDKQDLTLPRKEFELLFLLASKPGKVFTRDEIMNSVWGSQVIVGNRTIDVHIRKLREKIGDSYFKTIKGVGYKFNQ